MTPNAKPLRILDTGLRPARWNVAMTAALAEMHAQGEAADTVRFHRYPACVLLGAGQNVESAADEGYCRGAGVEIARRVTGGGAVYMSPGMLAWDVVVHRGAGDLEDITRNVCAGVAAGLSRLGVEASFRAPNDIAVRGRKVSGSSGYTVGRSAVLQGTVLLADEVAAMARALRLHETTLRERVTCLQAEIGTVPALPVIMESIAVSLAEVLRREPLPAQVHSDELTLCEALLRDEIGTDRYVAGRNAVPA